MTVTYRCEEIIKAFRKKAFVKLIHIKCRSVKSNYVPDLKQRSNLLNNSDVCARKCERGDYSKCSLLNCAYRI